MTDGIEQFAELWGHERGKYALVGTIKDPSDLGNCIIFNTVTRMAKVIEDDNLAIEVMRRMAQAGVPILDDIPDARGQSQ